MKAIILTLQDLSGFLDADEQPTNEELAKINQWYRIFCYNADVGEEEDYIVNYDANDYYPPFVAQAINNVLK
jgi:hypothetical protein